MKVLITDAQVRNAVTMIRSLGRRGFEVYTCDSDKIATGFFSKYVKKHFVYPDNIAHEENYIKVLNKFIDSENIDILFPIRDESVFVISKNRHKITNKVKIPITNYERIIQASNKAYTYKIAEKIGIPIPKTYFPKNADDLNSITQFPVILKPSFSSGSRGISFCENIEILKKEYKLKASKYCSYIVQEYIPIKDQENSEFDWYCLYDWDSNLKAYGCFRRIRSYPLNSGPSTFKESVEHELINEYATKILDHIKKK